MSEGTDPFIDARTGVSLILERKTGISEISVNRSIFDISQPQVPRSLRRVQSSKIESLCVGKFRKILNQLSKLNVSDVHIKADSYIHVRLRGKMKRIKNVSSFTPDELGIIANHIVENSDNPKLAITSDVDTDCSYLLKDGIRFRANICAVGSSFSIVLRAVASDLKSIQEIGLTAVLQPLFEKKQGLFLITGPTGQGKTTTLSAIIQYFNENHSKKIVIIEDPIENLYTEQKCTILQREVGTDTVSYAKAIRSALRQDPDIIVIGEIRDSETARMVVQAAETGHLVLSTMHTPNVAKSVHRLKGLLGVLGSFEGSAISQMISECLLGVLSQKLLPNDYSDGDAVLAYELLYMTKRAKEYIAENKSSDVFNDVIEKESQDGNSGAQTFEQHLYSLWKKGSISQKSALRNAESKENLLRLMELNHFESDSENSLNMDWSPYFKAG